MTKKITTKRIARNVLFSVIAQAISLITSFVLGFIVPKYISEYQYAYWQTYVLYVTYVGILHFGLLDGLVLRYSEYDYDQLDKPRLRSQFELLFVFLTIISICVASISLIHCQYPFSIIYTMVAAGIIVKNLLTYTSYTFQITNRINRYATLTVIDRVIYAIIVFILLFLKVDSFLWYCVADLVSDLIATIIAAFFNRGLYFGKIIAIKDALIELKENISAGILLMTANFTNNLVIGSAKMIVQWHWSVLIFGQLAFSFSVSNVFLTFITAISIVLFPSLKRMDKDRLPALYVNCRNIISPILNIALLAFFPGCYILKIWLPQYADSLVYLGILLPMVVYLSKVSLLTNNYLKAYRKEKELFLINVISLAVGLGLFLLNAYVLNNLYILLYAIVLVIAAKTIISEIVVMKIIHINLYKDFIVEVGLSIVFIICAQNFGLLQGGLVYLGTLIVYLVYCRKKIMTIFSKIRKR